MPTAIPTHRNPMTVATKREVPPFPVHRFSVDEYHALMDAGILSSGDPYELLDGWIVPKMTKNPAHGTCLALLTAAMQSLMPAGWHYRSQTVLTLATSEPEPDGLIVRGQPRDYVARHPTPADVALVIEIADSSLGLDRQKAVYYARDRVARYWIINLNDRVVEDHTRPIGRGASARYRSLETVAESETISVTLKSKTFQFVAADILP